MVRVQVIVESEHERSGTPYKPFKAAFKRRYGLGVYLYTLASNLRLNAFYGCENKSQEESKVNIYLAIIIMLMLLLEMALFGGVVEIQESLKAIEEKYVKGKGGKTNDRY